MDVSIIIVNYNVRQLLLECINSIYVHFNCVSFEIIVTDNNSGDGSCDAVKNAFPEVIIIRNNTNEGFSQANNQGIKASKGKYILLLNPDTCFFDSSMCRLIDFVRERGTNILVAPKLLNRDKSLQYSAWKDKGLYVMLQESLRIFKSAYKLEKYNKPVEVDNVAGAAMLFPKELVERIGYLDIDIFWMEDFDFCYRAREAGIAVYYFPGASIVHYGGQSSEKNLNIAYANSIISKLKFYKKHHPGWKTFLTFLLTLFHIIGYTLFLFIVSPFNEQYRKKIAPYFYTFRKFIEYLFTGKVSLT
jgi:GT2 family glycosyltransferase